MRTANPILRAETLASVRGQAVGRAMTVQGAVNKTGIMLVCLLLSASWVWGRAGAMGTLPGITMLGGIGGLIVAFVTIFKKTWAPVTAPLYAILEGLLIGGISALMEMRYPGIVIQAVMLTFGTLAAMLFAYTSGLIKVTPNFQRGLVAATGGIFLVYMASWILGFFGIQIPLIHEGGLIGIGFSLIVVTIAALNLVLDFYLIEQGAAGNMPKYMEWYAAFALTVTLVWLYIEILRLLAKLRGGRR